MVSELSQGMLGSLAILISLIYSMFQWFAGRDKNYLGIRARIWGRIISPIFFCSSVIGLSLLAHHFSWWYLTSFPAYFIAHTIGYGGDSLWRKILRRSIWSLTRTLASLSFAIFAGSFWLVGLQIITGLLVAVVLGVTNVLKAPQEEGLIKFANVFFVPFMVL